MGQSIHQEIEDWEEARAYVLEEVKGLEGAMARSLEDIAGLYRRQGRLDEAIR